MYSPLFLKNVYNSAYVDNANRNICNAPLKIFNRQKFSVKILLNNTDNYSQQSNRMEP